MDKEGEISMGGDRIHFYIEKREIEHHYNFHIYCSFLLILKNQDLIFIYFLFYNYEYVYLLVLFGVYM